MGVSGSGAWLTCARLAGDDGASANAPAQRSGWEHVRCHPYDLAALPGLPLQRRTGTAWTSWQCAPCMPG